MSNVKDIFGKPNTGLHSIRIANIAVVDVALTIFIGYLISVFFECDLITTIIVLFIIGEILHLLLGVETTVARWIKKLFN